MTQIILMLSQLILLPIQVRLWGQSATALWYSALALAAITYVVDCGLRTAGHADLLKANDNPHEHPTEEGQFSQIWSWIRILVLVVTVGLILCDFAGSLLLHSGPYPAWRALLIAACSLETVLIIRITYLDSLGRYRGAEASYFTFAFLRLLLSIPALFWLHWQATGLSVVYFLTAAVALIAQGRFLCRATPLLQLRHRFPKLSWKAFALARYTVAEPLSNWSRLNLPVLIIGSISPPVAVTTYVALRAVFGAGRTTIQQLARVASVECLKSRALADWKRAEALLTVFVLAAIFFGSALSCFVVIDNMRILGLWLKHFDRHLFQQIALAFALTAPFFSYQIPMNLMFRTGELARVARRHYAFFAYSCLFAGAALLVKSLIIYLGLLVVAELILAVTFFAPAMPVLWWAFAGSLTAGLLWLMAWENVAQSFADLAWLPMARSAVLMVLVVAVMALAIYRSYGPRIRALGKSHGVEPLLAVSK